MVRYWNQAEKAAGIALPHEKSELPHMWWIRNCRAIFTALVFPGYLAKPISSEASMPIARTYFLENIAKDEERRYSVYSSVTACPELLATSFAEINGKNT
jgi:hypothetical protein